ncbi:MAG: class II glutamine amidotransferase [Candidatus Marinimicrobia bacterium]|nr:class II glutamine amidotransferase [Candidatus Neomarinimicrobiota bacterium]MBL7046329.1 class II glutamine amidotransferase [Candidatus Neomarinimicrobiota bacterium]
MINHRKTTKCIFHLLLLFVVLRPSLLRADCRLWGLVASDPYEINLPIIRYDANNQLDEFQSQGGNNPNGWALLYYSSDNPNLVAQVWREQVPANEYGSGFDDAQVQIVDNPDNHSYLALGHLRYATSGATEIPDPHPFIWNGENGHDYTFAHNGSVDKDFLKALIEEEDENWLYEHPPQTYEGWGYGGDWSDTSDTGGWQWVVDSEIYFFWIMMNVIDNNYDVLMGISKALNAMIGMPNSEHKNFILSDGENIYAYRDSNGNVTNYSLYYKERITPSFGNTYKAVMSDPGNTYGWTLIQDLELVYLPRSGSAAVIPNIVLNNKDFKYLKSGWNWESFPRLVRDENGEQDAEEVMEPLVPDVLRVESQEGWMEYDTTFGVWVHYGGFYNLNSSAGYKIETNDNYNHYMLPVSGEQIDDTTSITLFAGQENWVGYFLEESQSPFDALPDSIIIEYLTSIRTQYWYIIKVGYNLWLYHGGVEPGLQGGPDVTFDYGDMYILTVDEDVTFQWQPAEEYHPPYEVTKSEYFQYTELSDYVSVIVDSIEDGDNIDEIGLFLGEECIGAEKVEGYPVCMRAYAGNYSLDNMSFQIVREGEVAGKIKVGGEPGKIRESVTVKNIQFEKTKYDIPFYLVNLTAGKDKKISSSPVSYILGNNYPNPFNLVTTISYSLNSRNYVELSVLNIKGQKVRTLFNGKSDVGQYYLRWDGKDSKDRFVASGIYIYRLRVGTNIEQKKMLLMK